jgi:uncharacterized protein YukE
MATIDALRSSRNIPEDITSISPDPVIATNRPGIQSITAADQLVKSLATFSQGVGTLYEQTKIRTKEKQKKQAALLARLEEDLPDGYYEEGIKEYDTARGDMQGAAISQILQVAESSLISRIEREGGDMSTRVLRYSSLLDGIVENKVNEVGDASIEFKEAMVKAIQSTKNKLESNYVGQVNKQFSDEQKTTLRSLISNNIRKKKEMRLLDTTVNEKGEVVATKKQPALIQLQDYNEFIRRGLRTTKFTQSELRGIWLERIQEVALSGVDSVGEPIPEVLNHVYTADPSGFKLIYDSEYGGAAEKAQISANKAYTTFHTNKEKISAAKLLAFQKKNASILLANMIKSHQDLNTPPKDYLSEIADLAEKDGLTLKHMTTLKAANTAFLKGGWTGDGGVSYRKLMQGVQTRAASITHDVIQEHLDAKLINPDEYADLNTKFNSFYSSAAKPYANSMYQQRKMLGKLLKDPEFTHTPGDKEMNLARTVPAYSELTEVMSDTTQKLMESGLNFASSEFLESWNSIVSEHVQRISAKEEYRPKKPDIVIEKKNQRSGGIFTGLGDWLFGDDEEGE